MKKVKTIRFSHVPIVHISTEYIFCQNLKIYTTKRIRWMASNLNGTKIRNKNLERKSGTKIRFFTPFRSSPKKRGQMYLARYTRINPQGLISPQGASLLYL